MTPSRTGPASQRQSNGFSGSSGSSFPAGMQEPPVRDGVWRLHCPLDKVAVPVEKGIYALLLLVINSEPQHVIRIKSITIRTPAATRFIQSKQGDFPFLLHLFQHFANRRETDAEFVAKLCLGSTAQFQQRGAQCAPSSVFHGLRRRQRFFSRNDHASFDFLN
jgi:hypothetical protein